MIKFVTLKTVVDLLLAFLLIDMFVDDTSSYAAGLGTAIIWMCTEKLVIYAKELKEIKKNDK